MVPEVFHYFQIKVIFGLEREDQTKNEPQVNIMKSGGNSYHHSQIVLERTELRCSPVAHCRIVNQLPVPSWIVVAISVDKQELGHGKCTGCSLCFANHDSSTKGKVH